MSAGSFSVLSHSTSDSDADDKFGAKFRLQDEGEFTFERHNLLPTCTLMRLRYAFTPTTLLLRAETKDEIGPAAKVVAASNKYHQLFWC